jgi:hypothetical protein
MSNQLSTTEERELANCEAIIDRNLGGFRETGEALMKIRDGKLYKVEFKTFEEYCQKRWNFGRTYAHRMIESAKVIKNLLPMGNKPESERQARVLAPLPPQEQREVWKEAVETAPEGKVTAKHVEEIVERKRRRIVLKKSPQQQEPEPEPELPPDEIIEEFICEMNIWAGRLKPVKLNPQLIKRAKAAVEAVVRELL